MIKEYTLINRYYNNYIKEKEELFLEKINMLLCDLDFSSAHDYIKSVINNEVEGYDFKLLENNKRYLVFTSEDGSDSVYIRTIDSNEKNIEKMLKITNNPEDLKGIIFIDNTQNSNSHLEIYIDNYMDNIIFKKESLSGIKMIHIKNKREIITDTLDNYEYILWALSAIGDIFFEFSEESNTQDNKKFIDIIGLMQNEIDKIVNDKFIKDKCKPEFKLSVAGYDEDAKIILSIDHLGSKFSEVIFPHKGVDYNNGFNIYDKILNLYNRTM